MVWFPRASFAVLTSLFTLAVQPLVAQAAEVAVEARLIDIVYPVPGEDSRWIGASTEISAVFPVPLAAVRAVLEDFNAYPSFFPRLVRTTVGATAGGERTIRQRYEVNILGYKYPTEYELIIREHDEGPERWVQAWTLAGSDGTIGATDGAWTLENAGSAEEPTVRVTHTNRSLIKMAFPLQDRIMRLVARPELSSTFLSVYEEARRRYGVEPERRTVLESASAPSSP
jgi:hypothetical protein